jgi:hypothetical protein
MLPAGSLFRFGGLLFVLLSLTAGPGWGQTQGQITGVITDPTGGVVVGAAVTVTNPATGLVRQVESNSAGNYVFPSLMPGVYNVKVEMQGFQTEVRNGVDLQVNQVARIDFQLKVGAVAETVEVAGGAPLLTTENATVGTVIENQRIVELPLNGRNYLQLVALSPNVNAGFASAGQAGSRQGGDRANQQLSISGNRREWNYFTLDGIDNTDVNFNTYIFLPSIDSLQEFKVQTGIYSAEFGREAGQVNVSTKGGTNEYHGALFEFLRNSSLDGRPYAFTSQVPAKAPFRWNQYGFTLGGPVRIPKVFNGKDRLFFMSNFEGFRLREQRQGIYSLPTAAMQAGDFSAILPTTVIRDPVNNDRPFPNNMIPAPRLHPIAKKLLEFYPPANIAGAGLVSNYLALQNNLTDKDQFTQRIDFVESSKSNWFGRYSWGDERAITQALKLNGTNLQTHVNQWMIDNTRVLRPSLVNEFRFGYNHFYNPFGRELAFQRNVTKEIGVTAVGYSDPPPVAWGIPAVSIQGFSGFGDDSEGPYVNYNHTFQWTDSLSWVRGKHSLKFGADIRRDRYNQLGNQFARGSFIIENQATGYGFADYMLGYTRRDEDSVALAVVQFRATSQAYYATDTWKVRSNVTVDMGLRYEYTPPWANKGDSLINAWVPRNIRAAGVADPSLHPALVRIGSGDLYAHTVLRFNPAINFVRDGRMGDRLIAADKNDFAPRLGIAWSPGPKWTVRSGFGVFYSQDTTNPIFDMGRNLAGRIRVEANTQTHDLTFDRPFGAANATSPCGVPTPPFVCISTPYVLGNKYDRRTPYTLQYELNIQRQLSSSTVVEVGYLGSQGHKLIRMFAFNEAIPGPTGSVVERTPFREFGRIQEIGNAADSNYHSFSVKLTRRFSSGLTYLAGYTFSRSIDDGSGIRTLGSDPLFPQNSYCISCERGLSIFDTRHRFVTSVLYDLPFGKGRPLLNHGVQSTLLGGWELSSIFTVSTGFPLTVTTGSDRSNTGAGTDRPNATGEAVMLDRGQRNPNGWFNIRAFTLEPLGTWGNTGRNTVIGPGLIAWDFSTLKNFKFTESKYVQFRFEAFNFPNHPNWSDPNTTLQSNRLDADGRAIPGTGNFGLIRGTRTAMRQLQFSLKVMF